MPRPRRGKPTPMPSVIVSLPKYVVARPRKDGTFRVLFEVPKRLRPSGWLPTIPTPPFPHRTGKLDLEELGHIRAHVEGEGGLLAQLEAARGGQAPELHKDGTLPALAALWEASWGENELRPRTQAFYRNKLRIILAWSETNRHPQASTITRADAKKLFALYKDRQSQRAAIKRTMSALFNFAVDEGKLTANPIAGMKQKRTQKKRAVDLWNLSIVRQYVDAAKSMGWTGGAILLSLLWETAADASDIVTWRRDTHFIDGAIPMIEFDRGKTGVPARIAISSATAAMIRTAGTMFLVTDMRGGVYRADDISDDNRRGNDFAKVRKVAMERGVPKRLMDHLRHSAATHAVECGATVDKLPSLTAHAGEDMLRQVYLQKTEAMMLDIQKMRGIV